MTFLMMACSKLSTSDLSNVINEVLPAAAKWYNIGLQLGMSADYLDTIKLNNDPQECSLKMLRQWLLAEPSWEALITALRSPTINYSALADKIEKKYCSVEPAIETHQQPVDQNSVSEPEVLGSHPTKITVPDPVDLLVTKQLPPKPSRIPKLWSQWKRELVQSFTDITTQSCKVSESQLEKAKQCVKHGDNHRKRYQFVEFEKLLSENKKLGRKDYHKLMTSSFDVLLKYIIDLIKPECPPLWRSIETADPSFQNHVACMKGYEVILQKAGYTVKVGTSLQFPDAVQDPDKAKLSVLAAELLMSRVEVEQMGTKITLEDLSVETTDNSSTQWVKGSSKSVGGIFAIKSHLQKPKSEPTLEFRGQEKRSASWRAVCSRPAYSCPQQGSYMYFAKESYAAEYNGVKFNFVNPPSSTLLCQQCMNLAYEPHQFQCCVSLFCEKCFSLNTCPSCSKQSETFPDRRSKKLIQSLVVWCPNSVAIGLDCQWKGKLGEVSDHQKVCRRKKVLCSYSAVGCEERMYRSQLKKHEIECRETHLDLAMKKVVSLTTTVEKLQRSVEHLKTSFQEFKELHEN